jgi:hypothetical protein
VPEVDLNTAIEQATGALLRFSIPLYYDDYAGRPVLYGTGFFVQAESGCFLVSAAHVLDAAKIKGLFYYCAPGTIRHLAGRLCRSKGEDNRDNDLIDVAVLRLSDDSLPPYPEVEKYAMHVSYLRPRYRPRTGKSYIFIGFPESKSDVHQARREVTVEAYAFRNEPIDEAADERHGLSPNDHIALHLDVRKGFGLDGSKQHFPKPNGMSGAPIVCLFDHNVDDDSRVFPVVGVATRYIRSSRLVFGTDIQFVLDAIKNAA